MKLIYKLSFLLILAGIALGNPGAAFAQNGEKNVISNQERTLVVYPTPATTVATVRLSAALRSEVSKIEIVNLIGRKIDEQSVFDKNTTEFTFNNLGSAASGIYMVVARDRSGKIIQSAKMVISR